VGVNHDGSVQRALELVEAAAQCGADAIKLQVFRAKNLMHESTSFAAYQRQQCPESDPTAMLQRYELSIADLQRIVEAAQDRRLIPIATPFRRPMWR